MKEKLLVDTSLGLWDRTLPIVVKGNLINLTMLQL